MQGLFDGAVTSQVVGSSRYNFGRGQEPETTVDPFMVRSEETDQLHQ